MTVGFASTRAGAARIGGWDRIQRIHLAEKNSIRTGAMAPGLTL
jgi:hypothetical protein